MSLSAQLPHLRTGPIDERETRCRIHYDIVGDRPEVIVSIYLANWPEIDSDRVGQEEAVPITANSRSF